MTCTYCQSMNSETDHRCRRCGRRLTGSAVSAPEGYRSAETLPGAVGATALAYNAKSSPAKSASATAETVEKVAKPRRPAQIDLFSEQPASRVIPFDAQQRESLLKTASGKRATEASLYETAEIHPPKRASQIKLPPRKQTLVEPVGEQSTLDFLPSPPVQAARTLKTSVEAVIYCDAQAATPLHRGLAAVLDGAMIFLGLGVFVVIFEIFGGPFTWTKQNIVIWLAVAGLISMFYGFVWAICGRETAGMDWTDLQVINFNGFPPDGKSRALRLIGCWLSYCSGAIGIFWALMDEEGLTWHDHMSKTFPTVREKARTLVRPYR